MTSGDQSYEILLIYLDNILLFSQSIDKMGERLDMVFTHLGNAGLKFKPQKGFFSMKEVSYLGHVILQRGVETDPHKTEVINNWPIPITETELRSFLGLASFFRKCVHIFSQNSNTPPCVAREYEI